MPTDDLTYWTESYSFDRNGVLTIKVSGSDGGTLWTGAIAFEPTHADYGFWRWVVRSPRRRQGLKHGAEISELRRQYARRWRFW